MTESDSSTLRQIVEFQLTLLDLYETLLDNATWDEERVNTTLKTFMSSVLALMRVQHVLGERVTAVQKDVIQQYRRRLLDWLQKESGTPDQPWAPAGDAEGPFGRGVPL